MHLDINSNSKNASWRGISETGHPSKSATWVPHYSGLANSGYHRPHTILNAILFWQLLRGHLTFFTSRRPSLQFTGCPEIANISGCYVYLLGTSFIEHAQQSIGISSFNLHSPINTRFSKYGITFERRMEDADARLRIGWHNDITASLDHRPLVRRSTLFLKQVRLGERPAAPRRNMRITV